MDSAMNGATDGACDETCVSLGWCRPNFSIFPTQPCL